MYTIKFKDDSVKEFETLVGADLREADLRNADLRNADLRHANLSRASLKGAILAGACLTEANLSNASLVDADLSNATLKYTNLSRASMRGANLTGANLDYSCLPLWCGSLNMIADDRIITQILFHAISLISCNSESKYRGLLKDEELLGKINEFHRVVSGEVASIKGE